MRILIAGSSSSIGRAFAEGFRDRAKVMTVGRQRADFRFDLTRWDCQPKIDGEFDVVIQVAADFGGGKDEDFIRAELVNAVGTLSVCRLAQHVHAKQYVLLSSIFAAYRPEDPYYGIYALSKRHSEEVARFFCMEREIALTILRPSQVYDARGDCRKHQALLYTMADRAARGQDIVIRGSCDARRNYLHLIDLTEICWRVLKGSHVGTYTCAHPSSVRLSEMAAAAFAAFGRGGRVHFLTDEPDLADLPLIDDDALYPLINYSPSIDIREGFRLIRDSRESGS